MAVYAVPAKPTIVVSSGSAAFCMQGTNSVILQSSAPSGNQWYKDGTPVLGETSQTLTLSDVSQSGNYTVKENGAGSCQSPFYDPVTIIIYSNPISNLPVSVNSQICEGSATNVQITNSQVGINYELYHENTLISGPVGGTGSSISLSTGVLMSGSYSLKVKATNLNTGCSTELVNTASITVNPTPDISLSSSNGNNSICPGETVTFTASSTTALNYEFFVDGVSRQNGASNVYSTSSLLNNQVVTVQVTTIENCKKTSNSILIDVIPLIATVSSSDPDNSICAGEGVTFTANASVATVSNYAFFINGTSVQSGTSNTYTTSTLTNGQTVSVKATTATGCSATSSGISTTVNPLPLVTLSNTDSDNTICQGEVVTFTASSATAVNYEFFINNISVQNSPSNKYMTTA